MAFDSAVCDIKWEEKRLEALKSTELLDSPIEEAFERFTTLAGELLAAPVCLISLVDHDRQFFKSQRGLPEPYAQSRETPLSHSFCKHVAYTGSPLIVNDATTDELVCENLAIRDLGVIAYLGVPITLACGYTLGSLCVIDGEAREWTDRDRSLLEQVASMVVKEIDLRLFLKEVQKQYQELRKAEFQREEMIHMLVHDLRNPLASVKAGLDCLGMGEVFEKNKDKILGLAQTGVDTLMAIINNMLEVQKSESVGMELKLTEFKPEALLEDAKSTMISLAEQYEVTIEFDEVTDQPMNADYLKLKRVLVNLIGNAIEHSSRADRSVVTLSARSTEQDEIEFWVKDNGCGIPEEAFLHIFEKFGQLDNSYRRSVKTGLGLCISRIITEAHQGKIFLESLIGEGSTFKMLIPVTQDGA